MKTVFKIERKSKNVITKSLKLLQILMVVRSKYFVLEIEANEGEPSGYRILTGLRSGSHSGSGAVLC